MMAAQLGGNCSVRVTALLINIGFYRFKLDLNYQFCQKIWVHKDYKCAPHTQRQHIHSTRTTQ